jgi:signal transduction histidine kinase
MRLKQIILQSRSHATKFVEQGYIQLRAEVANDNVTLLVEDSGPGIPRKARKALCQVQEFGLVEPGTGIGLCVCKNLA